MYSVMAVVKYCIIFLKVAKRVDLKYSHHHCHSKLLCEAMNVLTSLIVVIILQYICMLNDCVVHPLKSHNVTCELYFSKVGRKGF